MHAAAASPWESGCQQCPCPARLERDAKAQMGNVPRAAWQGTGEQGDGPGLSQRCSGGCRDAKGRLSRAEGAQPAHFATCGLPSWSNSTALRRDGAQQPRRCRHNGPLVFVSCAKYLFPPPMGEQGADPHRCGGARAAPQSRQEEHKPPSPAASSPKGAHASAMCEFSLRPQLSAALTESFRSNWSRF